jgi:hypothetical protein
LYPRKSAKRALKRHPDLKALVSNRVHTLEAKAATMKPALGHGGVRVGPAVNAQADDRWQRYEAAIDRLQDVQKTLEGI